MLSSPAPTIIASGLTALTYALMLWAHARMSAAQLRSLLVLAWLMHAVVLLRGLLNQPASFGFAPALSITLWLVLTVYLLESRLYPQLKARRALGWLGMGVVLLALVFPGATYPALSSPWMPLHWALGIASYGLIAAAVGHAWLMQRAERAMRQGRTNDTDMPLLTLERLTFRLVGAGFVLLTATVLAGGWFAESLNHRWTWNHKTVFSVLAWATMGVLLLGRWRLGWRGGMAARMVYLGAGLLLLGYAGSRFVIEVFLQR